LFVKTDTKLIIFSSFGGRKYDDSPKAIYEAMLQDSRFEDYKLMWAFMHPEDYDLPKGEKVRVDTLDYYISLLRARIWVTNSSMTRGLNFSGRNTFQINTWHGSTIKRMGSDINSGNTSFGIKGNSKIGGIMLAQGLYDVDVFSRAFNMSANDFSVIGLPRNDELAQATKEKQDKLKISLGIPKGKKTILYAPTFREYDKDDSNNVVLLPPVNLHLWADKLGNDYVLLFRAHYEVARIIGLEENEFVKDVSAYPNLNELMIASDLLISDYSSIFFDYAILGKPMLCYCYDYEKYAEKRGVYFDIRRWLPSANGEEELLNVIYNIDTTVKSEASIKFLRNYVTEFGQATEKSLDIIYEHL